MSPQLHVSSMYWFVYIFNTPYKVKKEELKFSQFNFKPTQIVKGSVRVECS